MATNAIQMKIIELDFLAKPPDSLHHQLLAELTCIP